MAFKYIVSILVWIISMIKSIGAVDKKKEQLCRETEKQQIAECLN